MPPQAPCTKKVAILNAKYQAIKDCLNEKGKRLWAAIEATSYGRGGVAAVRLATGLGKGTLARGIKELNSEKTPPGRTREIGGGRKKISIKQPGLLDALERLVEPTAKGDPESYLRWTSRSSRHLAR